ncbi:hypothetical protein [Pararhodobacter sp. SW119]|uniref:rhamnosyltransferase WsaF family glycosyltransferase n=1 Tax=Pararhodobacter sp. SW119 TaxID=2780075 RepID=UPI001ADF7BA2|nr:hypothetical protein [Pararhodobacter sp. SW119]
MIDRHTIKKFLPQPAKRILGRLRAQLTGPGIEYGVVRDYVFRADPDPRPRINLILPSLSAAEAFGGVATGLSFFERLSEVLAEKGIERRILSEQGIAPDDDALAGRPGLADCPRLALRPNGDVLPTRARDVFIVFNWWVSLNLEPVIATQTAHFGGARLPKIHLIQEYEPALHRFSAAHVLAREMLDGAGSRLWAVINSSELHDYYRAQGHAPERAYVFEPRMNGALRSFADGIAPGEKTRTLLVYGRPHVARNAFFLVQRSLECWARTHGADHRDWRIVSAGLPHDDLPLGNGHRLVSLGKLSLTEYGQFLRQTAAGLSLMISPHPSYPPLEMAHFGVRVVTNSYANKRPAARHENLIATPSLRPEAIAATLEAQIAGFEADPGAGLRAQSHMPDYLLEDRIECLEDVARDLLAVMMS